MTYTSRISLLAGAAAIAALGATAASAQTPDTRIVVIGAINDPAHLKPATDEAAVPQMPVVYETRTQSASAQTQPASAPAMRASQTPAASTGGANLSQSVKSQ